MATKFHSTLSEYLNRVNGYPRLTDDEELTLWNRWSRDSDLGARDAVVRSNLRHVVGIALKYYRLSECPLGELIAEGNYGLVCSLYRFDPSLGKPLIAYARSWIRAFILKFIIGSWSIVKPGSFGARLFFTLRREHGRLASSHEQPHDLHDRLAERFGVAREQISEVMARVSAPDESLNWAHHDDSTTAPIDQLVSTEDDQEQLYAELEEKRQTQLVVRDAMATLDSREQFIIMMHLMSEQDEWTSLDHLGRGLGISRGRTGQLEQRAKRKLRNYVAKHSKLAEGRSMDTGVAERSGK